MNKLVVGNLIHRPLRSLISVFAIAIEVIMILSIAAIMLGMLNGVAKNQSGIGADMVTHPGAASNLIGMSGASASVKVAGVIAALPHVAVSTPVYIKLTASSSVENIYGIDFASFNALKPFVFISGGPFTGPNDLIIDDVQAAKGFKVGDTMQVLSHAFRICGIVEHGRGGRKFIPIITMGQIDGNPGQGQLLLYSYRRPEISRRTCVTKFLATPTAWSNTRSRLWKNCCPLLHPKKCPASTLAFAPSSALP